MLQFSLEYSYEIRQLLFEEILIGVDLKFSVNPSSKRKVEENFAAESKQDLQITVFRAIKKAVTF